MATPLTKTPRTRKKFQRYGLPAMAFAGGLSALGYLRGRFERDRLFLPDRYPGGIWNPESYGLGARDCWFSATDGVDLHGWWIPHRKARGTVLYCHGNTGSLGHQVGILKHLSRLRANLFAFDYRGYGRSAGRPSEEGVLLDVRAAHGYLTRQLGQDPASVILFGHSLGGAIAIDAALDCEVAGLIAQSTFTHVRAAAKAAFPTLPLHLVARRRFRSIDKVGRLEMPKLFVHGDADGTLPVEFGRELFAAAAEPKDLYVVAGGGHNDVHRHGGFEYLRRIGKFRDRCLAL